MRDGGGGGSEQMLQQRSQEVLGQLLSLAHWDSGPAGLHKVESLPARIPLKTKHLCGAAPPASTQGAGESARQRDFQT